MDTAGPNAEQITYWNETAGPKWVALEATLDALIQPLGEEVMARLPLVPGARVLDVGCGTGQTSLELARRVGVAGQVLGVDLSSPMLARAHARADAAGVRNVVFREADAQTTRFDAAAADVCFSRFGVMFFADPVAAFTNLHAALRPGGRLGFICWQALPENLWMMVPLMAAAQHITLPPPPATGAPGPMSLADPERVQDILARAGFGDVALAEHRPLLTIGGGDMDDAVEFLLQGVGPTAAALREAGPELRATVFAAVREALVPYHSAHGVRLPGAAWIVTAGRP